MMTSACLLIQLHSPAKCESGFRMLLVCFYRDVFLVLLSSAAVAGSGTSRAMRAGRARDKIIICAGN